MTVKSLNEGGGSIGKNLKNYSIRIAQKASRRKYE